MWPLSKHWVCRKTLINVIFLLPPPPLCTLSYFGIKAKIHLTKTQANEQVPVVDTPICLSVSVVPHRTSWALGGLAMHTDYKRSLQQGLFLTFITYKPKLSWGCGPKNRPGNRLAPVKLNPLGSTIFLPCYLRLQNLKVTQSINLYNLPAGLE